MEPQLTPESIPALTTDQSHLSQLSFNFSVEEWRVLALINGKNHLASISTTSKLSEEKVMTAIHKLITKGIVYISS